jgi:hypothetical protein
LSSIELPAAVREWQARGRFVQLSGMEVFVLDAGPRDAAHTAVILHGFPSSSFDWRLCLPALSEGQISAGYPRRRCRRLCQKLQSRSVRMSTQIIIRTLSVMYSSATTTTPTPTGIASVFRELAGVVRGIIAEAISLARLLRVTLLHALPARMGGPAIRPSISGTAAGDWA